MNEKRMTGKEEIRKVKGVKKGRKGKKKERRLIKGGKEDEGRETRKEWGRSETIKKKRG